MQVKYGDDSIKPIPFEKLCTLSKAALLVVLEHEYKARQFAQEHAKNIEEKLIEVSESFLRLRKLIFAKRSERKKRVKPSKTDGKKISASKKKKPSERYPNVEVQDRHHDCDTAPSCQSCGAEMQDTGMAETSEQLTIIPQKFIIVRDHRHKYSCKCCKNQLFTAPAPPRILPGSSYSDVFILFVALSKFLDLIPMERFCQMAARLGCPGIPPQSLIGLNIKLAKFFEMAYERLRLETIEAEVLMADETRHRMLEGSEKTGWYLWAFLSKTSCFFECHDTRSGDVAANILKESKCEFLLSDVFAGYRKAVRETNELLAGQGDARQIKVAYCNAHARRGFTPSENEAKYIDPGAQLMIDKYGEIYALEKETKGQLPDRVLELRQQMIPIFEEMRQHSSKAESGHSTKSALGGAYRYFIKHFQGLTLFLQYPQIPIDNNAAERLQRSYVVGRKTWYGTHSKEGAFATVVHLSLIESCKLNGVNPREYYQELANSILQKFGVFTPREFKEMQERSKPPNQLKI